eukprot:15035048-Alexandrium_andersonii.AAC.1
MLRNPKFPGDRTDIRAGLLHGCVSIRCVLVCACILGACCPHARLLGDRTWAAAREIGAPESALAYPGRKLGRVAR